MAIGEAVVVLIPESTRKRSGGDPRLGKADGFAEGLPAASRIQLTALRQEVAKATGGKGIDDGGLMPAFRRYDGNMYRHIEPDAWERRTPGVEILIVSGLLGVVASRDTIPAYTHSMAEPMPPLGKLNRWWHEGGLPEILKAYLEATHPKRVIDLLSLEYREAVEGYRKGLADIPVRAIDFPGLGRASQPKRGERVSEILRTGKA
ncbi:MAG: peroxide stress protein YaaA [Methanobacteriota archaeon]